MIRVGFILVALDQGWLGGMSYFHNLFRAIFAIPKREVAPVIVTGIKGTIESLTSEFPQIEVIRTSLLDRWSAAWIFRKLAQKLTGRDIILERFLMANGIPVISHSGHLGSGARVRAIGWIPDFQHKHLPEMFSPEERIQRDRSYEALAKYSHTVILSSAAAEADFIRWFPESSSKSRVLRFVADPVVETASSAGAALRSKYDIAERYFHLPNHFWAHKNHHAVIDALEVLKANGRHYTVVATGNTEDHRHPGHLQFLLDRAQRAGVEKEFRILGVIPYADLIALMNGAVAVINPSRCEGWSTTVEEAKALGKQVILSDIAVHREQAPEAGRYFDPDNAAQLAQIMHECALNQDIEQDRLRAQRSRASFPDRRSAFAHSFQSIILDAARSAG